MQIATDTELTKFNNWVLRVRQSQNESPRLLVLLHGWTGDENSMWIFTRGLSRDYWMIAPRAPYSADGSGYSWRPLQTSTFGRPSLETLLPAAEGLLRLIDEYSALVKLDASQFDLMGFSQGAAMTNLMGFLYPQRVRKMGILAGFVPDGFEELIQRKPLLGKKVFVAHGTQDQTIPIDRAQASVKLLEQAGAEVVYCEADVGHKLSVNCLRSLETYLKD